MAKIITVTANTAIDIFLEIDGLAHRDNLTANAGAEFACGKGINVAKAIASSGHSVLCLGFAGSQSTHLFEALDSQQLKTDLIAVEGKTRTNITLFDTENRKETHIRTQGFTVTSADCRKLDEKLGAWAEAGDIVVFSGSLPPGSPKDFYRTLIEHCHRNKATVILDGSGQGLREGLKAKPYLIKPNLQELEEIAGTILPDKPSIVAAARTLISQGTQWVYVSCGEQGVVAVGEETAMSVRVKGGIGRVVSTVGCGDALVAGLAVALLESLDLEETIRFGIACGTANLYSREPGNLDHARLSEILNHIEMVSL
ncbi:MAG: 1-phosphofructokinase family hexose kinase [Methylosarcina sp.]